MDFDDAALRALNYEQLRRYGEMCRRRAASAPAEKRQKWLDLERKFDELSATIEGHLRASQ